MTLIYKRNINLLGNLEDPEEPERPEAGQPEGAGPRLEVHIEHLEDGAENDAAVEFVESRVEVVWSEGVHTDHHLEDEAAEEEPQPSWGQWLEGERKRDRIPLL